MVKSNPQPAKTTISSKKTIFKTTTFNSPKWHETANSTSFSMGRIPIIFFASWWRSPPLAMPCKVWKMEGCLLLTRSRMVRFGRVTMKVNFQFQSWKMMEKLDPFDGTVLDGNVFWRKFDAQGIQFSLRHSYDWTKGIWQFPERILGGLCCDEQNESRTLDNSAGSWKKTCIVTWRVTFWDMSWNKMDSWLVSRCIKSIHSWRYNYHVCLTK